MKTINRFFKPRKFTLANGKVVEEPRSILPLILIILLVLIYLSARITGFKFSTLVNRGEQFFIILGEMFPPDTNYAAKVWTPLMDTIKMSILGSFIGCLIAIPFAMVASVNLNPSRVILTIVRFLLSIVRTLPTLIIALIATYIFDIGTFAGTLAIAIFTFGIVVKMLYEQIETVEMGPFEAIEAVGGTKIQAFAGAILPQILPSYFSICLYSFEINVRYATILGYVGAGGIGLILNEKIGWREYDKVGMILFMLFITVVLIELLSKYIRERLG